MSKPNRFFHGLQLHIDPTSRVLIIDDDRLTREWVFHRLVGHAQMTWATTMEEVKQALEAKGPFDVYCLDYDNQGIKGGWYPAGTLIRQADPYSIVKTVLIHSANIEARNYYQLFPAAIHIQWDVLAQMMGFDVIQTELVTRVIERSDATTTPKDFIKLVQAFEKDM